MRRWSANNLLIMPLRQLCQEMAIGRIDSICELMCSSNE